jgi:hypothetical protein
MHFVTWWKMLTNKGASVEEMRDLLGKGRAKKVSSKEIWIKVIRNWPGYGFDIKKIR